MSRAFRSSLVLLAAAASVAAPSAAAAGPGVSEPAESSAARLAAQGVNVRALQQRLANLGYLPYRRVDGHFGPRTRNAVIAFQKWERLTRTGRPGRRTMKALADARRPTPRTKRRGSRVEALLDRQLVLFVKNGIVKRAIHVSTGRRGYATPRGSYTILRKQRRSWSVPYQVWLPWASYFVGGIAFHGFADVPVWPASHGCIRVPFPDARWLYRRMPVGFPVRVLRRS